jgi:hypothetical protein
MRKIINITLVLAACTVFSACENMMDIHQKYIEDGGEIVYLPKPLSTDFLAGKNRVVLRMALYNSPNVKTVDVYWNNGKDSVAVPVTLSAKLDTVFVSVPVSEEKAYTFTVYTSDAYGNRSLPVTGFGTAYGEMFQSSLVNQPVGRISLTEEGGLVQWSAPLENLLINEVRYLAKSNDSITVQTPIGINSLLPNIKAASHFDYRSLYLPEPNAIDTFYVDWVKYESTFPEMVLLDKSKFIVLAASDASGDGGGMTSIIDNDPHTYWHSDWWVAAPFPHWIIVDMGKSRSSICRIELWRRQFTEYTDTKTVQFLVSDNPAYNASTWRSIGSVVFSNVRGADFQILNVTPGTDTSGRYLKLFMPDNNGRSTITSLSEMDVYIN